MQTFNWSSSFLSYISSSLFISPCFHKFCSFSIHFFQWIKLLVSWLSMVWKSVLEEVSYSLHIDFQFMFVSFGASFSMVIPGQLAVFTLVSLQNLSIYPIFWNTVTFFCPLMTSFHSFSMFITFYELLTWSQWGTNTCVQVSNHLPFIGNLSCF